LKFSQGKTYHFFRIPESLLDDPGLEHHKLKADDMLSWQPIVQAAENFDETVRLAEHSQSASASQPVSTVTLKREPPAVDNVSQQPSDADKVSQPPNDGGKVTQPPRDADKVA